MKFVLYRDEDGEYRWRLVASNGRTVADSGEGYKNKADCRAMVDAFKKDASEARVVEQD